MKQTWKQFFFFLLIPLIGGFLISFFINSTETYSNLEKPPFSPPSIVFPIVWTILYLLMGISSYLIWKSNHPERKKALFFYWIQLLLNYLWPILFFTCQTYFFALIELFILLYALIQMIYLFFQVNKVAGYLQIPYLLWLLFATYLNMGIVFLN